VLLLTLRSDFKKVDAKMPGGLYGLTVLIAWLEEDLNPVVTGNFFVVVVSAGHSPECDFLEDEASRDSLAFRSTTAYLLDFQFEYFQIVVAVGQFALKLLDLRLFVPKFRLDEIAVLGSTSCERQENEKSQQAPPRSVVWKEVRGI
jgi:hypothetical protein